jgi:hypothetical protein
MQVISIVIAALMTLWAGLLGHPDAAGTAPAVRAAAVPAVAAGGGQWPVAVVPAGSTEGVTLRAQTVDVTIGEEGDSVYADTQVWLRLSNPTTQTVSIAVALPGPGNPLFSPLISPTLPADLKLTLEDEPLAASPAPAAEAGAPAGLTADVSVPAGSQAGLRVSYRQTLPQRDGLALFTYPALASGRWGNTPESLRVTVKFALPLPAEEILGQFPDDGQYDGQSLTWEWSGAKAGANVWAAFLTPAWWAQFSATRSKAAAADATPADQVALSRLYQQLAGLPPLPFAPETDFYNRYYPAAIAALQAATSTGTPSADVTTAHGLLADLYDQQARRLGADGGSVYLKLAATEAQAALDAGAADPALRKLAADAYLALATRARSNGDTQGAEDYLAQLATVQTPENAAAAATQQAGARLQAAALQIDAGQLADARRIISDTFGLAVVEPAGLRPPMAGQALLSVDTGPSHRTMRLTLSDYREPAAVKTLVSDAANAVKGVRNVATASGPDWLELDIPYADLSALSSAQREVAAALPGTSELALLSAALTADRASLMLEETPYRRTWRYTEQIDLHAAQQTWEKLAARLEAAAQAPGAATAGQPGTPSLDGTNAAQLAHIQQALWTADAAAWRSLATASRAEYRLDIPRAGAPRAWVALLNAPRTMTTESAAWRYDRFMLIGGGVVLLALILSFVIWRWG